MRKARPFLIAGCLVIGIPLCTVAVWWILVPLRRDPPRIIGIEVDAGGQIKRQIVFEGSHRTTGWLPDPEGGHHTQIDYRQFFLEMPGQPREELRFLHDHLPDSIISGDLCRPVTNSSLWIAAGFFEPGSQIHVVVFDGANVRTHRKIDVNPDWYHPGHDFWFEDGNRKLKYHSSTGDGCYDVLSDSIQDGK
jgi:hypothetical protein